MLRKEDFEFIGTLGRTHGIQGEIAAKLSVDISGLTDGMEEPLFLMLEEDGLLIPHRVLKLRPKNDEIDLILFSGINTKEQAETLMGRQVWLDREYLDGTTSEDLLSLEHYVDFQLYHANTRELLGVIEEIDDKTMNTLLRVVSSEGDELVLPISEELIEDVDLSSHQLYLHIPEGLLELS